MREIASEVRYASDPQVINAYNDYFHYLEFNKSLYVFGLAQIKGTNDLLIATHMLNTLQRYWR